MRNSDLLGIFMVTVAACRGLDNEQSRDPRDAEHAEHAEHTEHTEHEPQRANDRMYPLLLTRTSESPDLDWMDIPMQSAALRGKSCCVNCDGDFKYSRYNLGNADNCGARAKTFCEHNRGSLINAGWGFC